jgi:uncharacterized protein (TIGR02594 family)
MQFMRSTLLLFCAVAFLTSPASARSARHHAGHSHHHHRVARDITPAAANTFAALPDRHAVEGASFGGLGAPDSVADVQPRTRHSRRMNPAASNSFASAPVNQAAPSGPSFGGGNVVAEARRWIGGNPTGSSSLWCGNFMNFVLERTGRQGSSSNMARSFASYGNRISGPQVGAIAVMSRGKRGGHVGVVSGIDANGNPIIISGNHGRRVAESTYPRGRIFAYVMP